jgi:hypothetical protein
MPTSLSLLLLGLAAAMVASQTLHALEIYRGSTRRRSRNVSGERRPVGPKAAPFVHELLALGFRRLGELELSLPDMGLLGAFRRRLVKHTCWLLVDGPATSVAVVGEVGPICSFESWLEDGVVIQTLFPRGERIELPDYVSSQVRTSLREAYDHHRRQLDARLGPDSYAQLFQSGGDYLRFDASFRERFARRSLRGPLIRRQLLPAGVVLALCAVVAYLILARAPQ